MAAKRKKRYAEVYEVIDRLKREHGRREYKKDILLPEVVESLRPLVSHEDTLAEIARSLIDSSDAQEDRAAEQPEALFSYESTVALGGGHRILRGYMNFDQHVRRKLVLDHNKAAQDRAWNGETEWTNEGMSALVNESPDAVRQDVLPE